MSALGENESVGTQVDGGIRHIIQRVMNEYISVKKEKFAKNPFGTFVRKDIPRIVSQMKLFDEKAYLIQESVGKTNWADVMWWAVLDRSITTTVQKGIYIVYLLSKDGNTLYLTLNQGCKEFNGYSKKACAFLRERAAAIIERIDGRGFKADEDIYLGEKLSSTTRLYQPGTIFFTEYEKGNIPSEEALRRDLTRMMEVLDMRYISII